jgi:hypothetical protein
VLLELQAFKVT